MAACSWGYPPRLFGTCGLSPSRASRTDAARAPMASPSSSVRIAVVGDVHDQWNLEDDTKALQFLKPDVVLFTGDFGNENVELVQSVANLDFAKAVILGNHDSWKTQQFSGKRKDNIQMQLECLGQEHVAYGRLDFPHLKLTVVGGRPFSCGGEQLFRKRLISARYGVENMEQSAQRIYKAAIGAPEDHFVIFLAHNGPTGLGANIDDICGRDWIVGGGDHGDPDLAKALSQLRGTAKFQIPLVVFGHMHKQLAHGNGLRKMIAFGPDNMIYLNGAIVPRVRWLMQPQTIKNPVQEEAVTSPRDPTGSVRAFTVVDFTEGKVTRIAERWVSVAGDRTQLEGEHILF
ncbi:hypothetical protein SAY87_008702 [Trapa incisa]|uniref:Calcineurin-like phosphoesterase domain-containing protein n=1 Tax=Trapa incisa TaxID=236973 RepID=A0AAN7JYM7_9MYRT|nr:hypothetical protein SAY87_008702 [Trapa incisa]